MKQQMRILCIAFSLNLVTAIAQTTKYTLQAQNGSGDKTHTPSPCCFPFKFQATIVPLNSFSINNQKIQRVRRDWESRLQVQESVLILQGGKEAIQYRVIADYGNMVQYIISAEGCQTRQINYGMLEPCMPADATYLGKTYIGQLSDMSNIDGWYYHKTDQNRDIEMTVAVTSDGCVPVLEHITGTLGGGEANTLALFTNFTEVVDDQHFKIPPECHEASPM